MKVKKNGHVITKEKLYSVYSRVLNKMAIDPELLGTEVDAGILIPMGCKKGIQVFVKAIRVFENKGKYYYGKSS